MTTPTPDKLEIPEAAEHHAVDLEQCAIFVDSEPLKRSMTDAAAFLRSLPHMPDRGYAEGIEAAARTLDSRARNAVSSDMERIISNDAAAIRALAPPAPADNGTIVREWPEEWFNELMGRYETPEELAEGMRISANFFREKLPTGYLVQPRHMAHFHDRVAVALERFIAAALSSTPSPIEDVAPSEAETTGSMVLKGLESAKAAIGSDEPEDIEIAHRWIDEAIGLIIDQQQALAARRVRPSPVDEDARDGVLEEAVGELVEVLDEYMVVTSLTANDRYATALDAVRTALQSQRKG